MSEQESADVVQKQQRKRRVQSFKRLIVVFLLIAILFPTILCMILFVKLSRVEKQLEALRAQQTETDVTQEGFAAAVLSEKDVGQHAADVTVDMIPTEGNLPENEAADAHALRADTVSANTIKVYLTFDDGPSGNTGAILDILKEYQVKATFFVTGKSEEYTPLYQRIVEEGHTIGMHSYSHKYREIYQSVDSFREDLYRLQDLIYERCGVVSTIYRFPGGSSNTVSKVDMQELIAFLNDEDISYYDWNVSSLDASGRSQSVSDIVENVTGNIRSFHTAIVLMHDANDKTTTVEALPMIIERLQAMDNVELLPITENTVKIQHTTLEK